MYAVSGSNSAAITPATASSAQYVLGKAITSGRVFWLRGLSVAYNATNGPIHLVDASSGATATGAVLSVILDPSSDRNVVLKFAPPGLQFRTGCAAFLDASGSIPIGRISGWGFEE